MNINIISTETRNELTEIMRCKKSKNKVLLGEDSTNDAFTGVFECIKKGETILQVGLISDNMQANIGWLDFEDSIWIGFNDRIEIVDYNTGKTVKIENNYCTFCEFHRDEAFVIAFFETAVVCISKEQNVMWEHFTDDIISNFYIENDKIYITTFEGKYLVINIVTGKEIA